MSTYLHIQCGPHQLLLDVAHVVEVADCPAAADQNRQRIWREHTVPVLDLATFLGVPTGNRRQQIAVRDTRGGTMMVDVDLARQLLDVPDTAFAELVDVTDALHALVDGVCIDPESGTCLLRVRHPFAWASEYENAGAPP